MNLRKEDYYDLLRKELASRKSSKEVEEMTSFVQESAMESGLDEEEYLTSLGSPEEVALILCGESEPPIASVSQERAITPPPIPSDAIELNKGEDTDFAFPSDFSSAHIIHLDPSTCLLRPDFSQIRKIKIDGYHMEVAIDRGSEYNASDYGVYCTEGASLLKISEEEGKLSITGPSTGFMQFFRGKPPLISVTVILPANYVADKIGMDLVKGDLSLSRIQSNKIHIDLVSASLEMENCAAEKIKLSTVSGDSRITGCKADKMRVDTVSGSLDLLQTQFNDTSIDTVSGNMNLETSPEIPCKIECVTAAIIAGEPYCWSLKHEIVSSSLNYYPEYLSESKGLRVDSVSGTVYVESVG